MKSAYGYEVVVNGVRRYVGKGRGVRKDVHMQIVRSIARRLAVGEIVRTTNFYNKLTKAWLDGAEISVNILVEELTDKEAFAWEIEMIADAPSEQLWNTSPGGKGFTPEQMRRLWANPNFKVKMSAKQKARWNDDKRAEWSERAHQRWADSEYRAKVKSGLQKRGADPEYRAKLKVVRKKKWTDPEYKAFMKTAHSVSEAHRAKAKIQFADPKARAEASKRTQQQFADPKARAEASKRTQQQFADPERRRLWSERTRQQWADPKFKAKVMAAHANGHGRGHE